MTNVNSDYYFLEGGGKMGEQIRAKDWSKTSLGEPSQWPQSLCTLVAVMLNTPFGMYIAWGKEFIQLYNDGYRPILGTSKHPEALGISTRETFSEVWHIIESMFDDVMNGNAVGFSDFMLPLNRNGFVEECYFDFSYSPIKMQDGKVGGVLVTVVETSEKKKTSEALTKSNARYVRDLLQAPVAICVLRGKDHVVEIANDKMLQIWGKKAEEVINKPIFEGLPEAKNQGLELLVDTVYATGEKFSANERLVNLPRNGKIETIYLNFVYDALKDADNTVTGIIAIAVEVTQQVIARKKIEESEQRFQAAIQAMEGILWTNNGKGEMEGEQPGWSNLTGQTYEEYIGFGWTKMVFPDDLEPTLKAWEVAVQEGKIFIFEHRVKTKDFGYRHFAIRSIPLKNEDGSLIQWVGVSTDIHDRKLMEERKDEFISIASHELKTPLTTAKAYLQMLELSLDKNAGKVNLFAKKASQSVNRLNTLISDLLDVSKIKQGKLNYTVTTFNFNTMVLAAMENIQLTSPHHTIIKSGQVTDLVTGDEERLQQVVCNLLSNAIKYSPKSDKVYLNFEQNDESIILSVKDTGIGIQMESQKKIFEKYHRIEEHAVQFQGLGIGLFISHEIIERHYGQLWVESKLGEGSTFHFTIPVNSNKKIE